MWKICIETPFFNCERIHPLQQKNVSMLIRELKNNKHVRRILIFGSSVTSRCHMDSDIDIYVELEQETKLICKYFPFCYDMWTNFTVDDRLLEEIQRTGVVVYEK